MRSGKGSLLNAPTREGNNIHYEVNDRKLTRAELSNLVANSPDRQVREQAWKARGQITARNGERIRQAMKLRNDLALRFTDVTFSIFMLRCKGVQTQELFSWFDQLRTETEPEYQQLLEQMRCELHIEEIKPWDLEYYFSILTNDFEQKHFAPEDGWSKTKQLAGSLGYDLDKLPVEIMQTGTGQRLTSKYLIEYLRGTGGGNAKAKSVYQDFLNQWKDADPDLAPPEGSESRVREAAVVLA